MLLWLPGPHFPELLPVVGRGDLLSNIIFPLGNALMTTEGEKLGVPMECVLGSYLEVCWAVIKHSSGDVRDWGPLG